MAFGQPDVSTRLKGAAGAVLGQLLLAFILLNGLTFAMQLPARHDIATFILAPPPPPPPPPPVTERPHAKAPKKEGRAAPANLTARPKEVVAPPKPVPTPPVAAAPIAAKGPDASAGASNRPGPGTGAGGAGNGTGSGGSGNGTGGGGGGTPLRWVSGQIKDSDYPRDALKRGIGGTVYLRFTVGVNGRVTDCLVTRSSGNAELDSTTCRLILARFRYKPTRDAQGHPVPDVVTGEHVWEIYGHEEGDGDDG